MRKHVPNLITCLNVTCGVMAILLVMEERAEVAGCLVLLAMVFDFLDGLVARLLGVTSALGKELDSLADVVSFGVAPALLARVLIGDAAGEGDEWTRVLAWIPAVIPAFSAYRLAKFNLDTRQGYSFTGMPTPAHALFWVSLVLTRDLAHGWPAAAWGNPWVLAGCVLFFSVLLVSGLPMFSLKMISYGWRANRWRYPYFVVAVGACLFLGPVAFSLLVPLYVLFAVLEAAWGWWRGVDGYKEGV